MCVRLSEFVLFLLYLRNKWKYLNETDHRYSLPGTRYTDDIQKINGSKVKATESLLKMHILRRRHTRRRFTVEDHQVIPSVT